MNPVKKIDMDSFICSVSEWINQYRNQPVLDYHYSCMHMMAEKNFINEIKSFLFQRIFQMYGLRKEDLPRGFLGRAAKIYIQEVM